MSQQPTTRDRLRKRQQALHAAFSRVIVVTLGEDARIDDELMRRTYDELRAIETEYALDLKLAGRRRITRYWLDYDSSREQVRALIEEIHQLPDMQPLIIRARSNAYASERHQGSGTGREIRRIGRPSHAERERREAEGARVLSAAEVRRQAEIEAGRPDPWTMPYRDVAVPTTLEEAYQVVRTSRDIVTDSMRTRIESTPVSTRRTYERALATMGSRRPEVYATSKPRFYVARAALRWGIEREIIESQRCQAAMQKQLSKAVGQAQNALLGVFLAEVGRLRSAMARLAVVDELYPSGTGVVPPQLRGRDRPPASTFVQLRETALGERVVKRSTTASKRRGLRALPGDWTDVVVKRAWQTGNRHSEQIAVLAMVGCRPVELAQGVEIEVSADGQSITATVVNMKVRRHKSDGRRTLEFHVDSSAAAQMLAQHTGAGRRAVIGAGWSTTNALSAAINRLAHATEICPGRVRVTAYSFRHQLAADAKAAGWDADQIAQMLGHGSEETQTHYGVAVQGRGSQWLPRAISTDKAITKRAPTREQRSVALQKLERAISAKTYLASGRSSVSVP